MTLDGAGRRRVAAWWIALCGAALGGAATACGTGDTGSLDLFAPNGLTATGPSATSGRDAQSPHAGADGGASGLGGQAGDARPAPTVTASPTALCPDGGCGAPTGCRIDGECQSGSASLCDPTSGVCVECMAPGDCSSGDRPLCDAVTHRCVECVSDSDCLDPGKPGCLKSTGRCEECSIDAQCQSGKTCDTTQGQCR